MVMPKCTTPGCPGDGRYASPGRGHVDVCQFPKPYDGPPLPEIEWREHEGNLGAMAQAMTIVYLFGAAVRDATGDTERLIALGKCKDMLEEKAPFADVGKAILDSMGPMWTPDPHTMQAIEALHMTKED